MGIKGVWKILLVWLMVTLYSFKMQGQQESDTRIETISFHGIEKNKEAYLRLFSQSQIGESLSDSLLLEDIQRLKNIPSIGDVSYVLDTIDQSIDLVFQIEETKTLFPIVNFGSVKNNTWFQLGFSDLNWRGNGSLLSVTYQNRDSRYHGGQIYYRAPRLRGSDWGFSATLNKTASLEPLFFEKGVVDYEYSNHKFGASLIKEFGFQKQLEFGGTYFVENYLRRQNTFPEYPIGPESLKQSKFLTKLEFTNNSIDYHYFYLKGIYWKAALQNVYTFSDETWFQSFQLSGRYFSRVGEEANLALRFIGGIATNNDSPFAPYVVDSHTNLRGVGSRAARGTAQLFINLEYRKTIHETKEWGVQLVSFLDVGTWREPGSGFDNFFAPGQFKQFIGGGFRLIYKEYYDAVLRVDYGINIQDILQRGVIVGFGQYF